MRPSFENKFCAPGDLARLAAMQELGLDVEILEEDQLTKLGMGALLGVGQGSESPSKVVVMRWRGGTKGVVFDTGGISIKPAAGMEEMTMDMGGAGVVAGVMRTLALRKAKANVVGLVGLVENMPDGRAQRPGDVVKSMKGDTIEVINTDAEGRLVLADGLCWAKELGAAAIVDVATLTGAVTTALGDVAYGLMTNNDAFCSRLEAGATAAGEKTWRLPMWKEYDEFIKSDVADCKNTGTRGAGTIVGAKFLEPFVGDTPWVHMDIAGVDIMSGDKGWISKGASGYSVRAMINLALAMG